MIFRIVTSVEIEVDMNGRKNADIIKLLKSEAEGSAYAWYEDCNDLKVNATVEILEEKSE